jgi:hypothetical protein
MGNDINKSINEAVESMCKENNINYKKQDYKILFSKETLFFKNNDVSFTSGSKNYLSFYGKVYLTKNDKVTETIHLASSAVVIDTPENSILVLGGGVKNSTKVENDKEILHFYIAPNHLLRYHDSKLWQTL